MDDHTFVVDWRVLGNANAPDERWTMTFEGEKVNVRVKIGKQPEVLIYGQSGD